MSNEHFQSGGVKEGMLTKMSSLNEFIRNDKLAAKAAKYEKAYNDLKRMRWQEDDIDRVLKACTIDISWQAHIAGYKDVIIEQDESDDDSNGSDDLRSRMNSRVNTRKKIEERSTPTKKKKKRGVA